MGDLFSSFFGGGGPGAGRAQQRREGRDMGVGLRLTLEEVAAGAKKEIVYDRLAPCPDCGGTGLGEGGREVTCPDCNGTGRVVTVQRTFLGDMQSATTCKTCGGTGNTIENPCPECEGQGRVPDRQRVTVEVPVGHPRRPAAAPFRLRRGGLARRRRPATSSSPCRIQPHEFFERDGDNLHARANVIHRAGGPRRRDRDRRHLRGREGRGAHPRRLPERAGRAREGPRHAEVPQRFARGSCWCTSTWSMPKKLTKKQRELLEQLAHEMGEDVAEARSPFAEAARRV